VIAFDNFGDMNDQDKNKQLLKTIDHVLDKEDIPRIEDIFPNFNQEENKIQKYRDHNEKTIPK